jgi:hypothetical protein
MKTILATAAMWLALSGSIFAQQTTGSIAGRIVDQTGAALADAIVTARDGRTGVVRMSTADAEGLYRLPALPVGIYDVTVELRGFAQGWRKGVAATVAQTQTIEFVMSVAPITQAVTVTGDLPLVSSTSSSVEQIVDPRRVQELPIDGRQFANLAATLPGVGIGFHSDPTKGTNYAPYVDGGAGRNINYVVDGGDNNDDTVGGLLQQFPLEAIDEFNFQTERFKAEYGRSDGGVMNVVTKSGTNQVQGTMFELFRDRSMNALTETEKVAGLGAGSTPTKGAYQRNQFGGSLGGPIVMDRVHFFFALERTQQDTTQTVNTKGLFPALDGVYPTLYRENLGTAKVSANVTANQYLTIRYGGNDNSFPFGASPANTPDNWGDATNVFHSVNANHNWVLGGTSLNELIVQYSTFRDHIAGRSQALNESFPNGVTTGGSLAAPQTTEQVKYQLRDDFSWHITGHGGLGHDFKAGVNFIDEPRLFIENTTGKGIVSNFMLTTSPTAGVRSVIENDGDSAVNIPTRQYGMYLQDDWRVGDRLTVNAGVRYDLVTGIVFDQSLNPNFEKIHAAAVDGRLAGIVGLEHFGLSPRSDRNNVQPRIGGVLDVNGNGRDVVRAGWGVYTDFGYTNSNVLTAALDASGTRFGPIFSASDPKGLKNADGTLYQPGEPLSNIAPLNKATDVMPVLGFFVDPRLQQPYELQTNVGWSHELTPDTVISLDFVSALGRDLNYKPRLNQLIPGTPIHRISALLSSPLSPNNSSDRPALSVGRSRYDALLVSGRRRLSNGIDFLASYTLSRSLSTIGAASDELNTANIQDANNPFAAVQLGPNVTTDARHQVSASAIFQLPYGVQIAPLFMYRSALPIFIINGRDLNGDGDTTDIPMRAFAVSGTDAVTGKATFTDIGACTTVNCGRGWPQSQLNLRVSKSARIGHAGVQAILEVFNVFNAINPSNVTGGQSVNRAVTNAATGAPDPSFLQPASFSGDSQRPEQRIGQIGLRISF